MFEETKSLIKLIVPKTKIIQKEESILHRIISKLLFFVDYDNFNTTIGFSIAMQNNSWWSLVHECIHVLQSSRQTRPLHSFLYLFPQSLFPIALPICAVLFGWWSLLTLLLLLPWPAYFRMKKEMEAYRASFAVRNWMLGYVPDSYFESVVANFVGVNYYFMWPFESYVRRKLRRFVEETKDPFFDMGYFMLTLAMVMKDKGVMYDLETIVMEYT